MRARRDDSGIFIVHLERGDTVRKSLEGFAAEHGIEGARVTAIGAVENAELACYDLPTQTYDTRVFSGIYELLSGDGNITRKDGRPFLHMHVSISGHDYVAYGGHLMDAAVGVVMEVFVDPLASPIERGHCAAVGLAVWQP